MPAPLIVLEMRTAVAVVAHHDEEVFVLGQLYAAQRHRRDAAEDQRILSHGAAVIGLKTGGGFAVDRYLRKCPLLLRLWPRSVGRRECLPRRNWRREWGLGSKSL